MFEEVIERDGKTFRRFSPISAEEADRLLQLYMSSLTHYYKIHKSIYVMHEDPAWDEYMSTGIDTTGGKLGPDINTE